MRGAAIFLAGAAALCGVAMAARSPVPTDNPTTPAKVELGRRLFYDADLSLDGTMACSTCHEQHRGFADGNSTHGGVHGDPGKRNVPGLANVGTFLSLTWGDPRIRTLEAQASVPVFGKSPVEMGMEGQEAEIVRRLAKDDCYRTMFAQAFPESAGRIDFVAIARALSAFERTMVATAPPPASALARQGRADFRADGCAGCHAGALLTDGKFHIVARSGADRGLGDITGHKADYSFRTPSLINVAVTEPYLHDGSARTLEQAITRHEGVTVPAADMPALLAYLAGLTDEHFLKDRSFSLPDQACGRAL